MERPIFKPIGTPTEQLDTPSLIVDVDALDHNIATVASFFENSAAKLRPHVEAHRTPAIAHKQPGSGRARRRYCRLEHRSGRGFRSQRL